MAGEQDEPFAYEGLMCLNLVFLFTNSCLLFSALSDVDI